MEGSPAYAHAAFTCPSSTPVNCNNGYCCQSGYHCTGGATCLIGSPAVAAKPATLLLVTLTGVAAAASLL